MDEGKQTKMAYALVINGDRPRRQWLDNLEEDLQVLGMDNWQEKTMNREEWRQVLPTALNHNGSES